MKKLTLEEKHLVKEYAKKLVKKINEDTGGGTFFAILTVQNPYSSGDRGKEYGWTSNYQSEDMTRSEFIKMAKRSAERLQSKYFYDTIKGGGTVKIYTDRNKFKDDYKKLSGYFPKLQDE